MCDKCRCCCLGRSTSVVIAAVFTLVSFLIKIIDHDQTSFVYYTKPRSVPCFCFQLMFLPIMFGIDKYNDDRLIHLTSRSVTHLAVITIIVIF